MTLRRFPPSHFSLAFLTAILLVSACQEDPKSALPRWTVAVDPEISIGEMEGAEPYLFQDIRHALFLPDGRIAVADAGLLVIRFFRTDGLFQTEVGGEGEGPGEFRSINGLWLTPSGSLGVWDGRGLRLTFFSPEGDLLDTTPVARGDWLHPLGNLEVFLGLFSDGSVALAALVLGNAFEEAVPDRAIPDRWILYRLGSDGEYVDSLGTLLGMRRWNGNPLIFTPVPHVAVIRDSVFAVDGYGAQVRVLDGSGSVAGFLELDLAGKGPGPSREASKSRGEGHGVGIDDVWPAVETRLRESGQTFALDLVEQGRLPREEEFPRVSGLFTDRAGHVWAKVFDPLRDPIYLKPASALHPAPGGVWKVFQTDGTGLATVTLPEELIPLEIREDRILGLTVDEWGVERVAVYTLVHDPAASG